MTLFSGLFIQIADNQICANGYCPNMCLCVVPGVVRFHYSVTSCAMGAVYSIYYFDSVCSKASMRITFDHWYSIPSQFIMCISILWTERRKCSLRSSWTLTNRWNRERCIEIYWNKPEEKKNNKTKKKTLRRLNMHTTDAHSNCIWP